MLAEEFSIARMKIRIRIGGFLLLWIIPRLTKPQKVMAIAAMFSILVNFLFISGAKYLVPTEPPKKLSDSERAILLKLLDEPDLKKAKELLENPKANQKIPEKAKILSDQNSNTALKEAPEDLKNSKNVEVVGTPENKANNFTEENTKTEEDVFKNNMTITPFLKRSDSRSVFEKLTGKTDETQQGMAGQTYELSTYRWDFAPFMLKWKSKMTDNWYRITSKINFNPFAPIGSMEIYVKMNRLGQLLDSKVVSYNCDKSFVSPAYASVVNSFPLDPLPENFPDQYLETTWTISIINNN